MRTLNTYFLALLFFTWFFSCQSKDPSIIKFEIKTIEENRCVEEVCASVKLNYLYYLDQSEAASQINSEIESMLIKAIALDEPEESLSLAVSNFLDSFELFAHDYGSFSDWYIEADVQESFQNAKLITVLTNSSSFLGGAHPNSYQNLVNFEKSSGNVIPLKLLMTNAGKLLEVVEKKFRNQYEVDPNQSLEEDGRFFLKNDKHFFLPMNMGFTENGLRVIYNPYEIGPYVMGYTIIDLPWEEAEGLVSTQLEKNNPKP
jgi:hypothetical protein